MKVLVACEFSGTVRDAFTKHGHYAVSCDLLPSEKPGLHHEGNVLDILLDDWDLMIAHPPCTYLANSGTRWLYKNGTGKIKDNKRWQAMEDAANFFLMLCHAPIPCIAIENPIMHGHAKSIIGLEPSQVIQPCMFGHDEIKTTHLWLKNLPPLKPTKVVYPWFRRVHYLGPSENYSRKNRRSVTYTGIANAMAEQWGKCHAREVRRN
jgi:hypothetical protein